MRKNIINVFTELGLHGMRAAFDKQIAFVQKRHVSPEKFLQTLLEAELARAPDSDTSVPHDASALSLP